MFRFELSVNVFRAFVWVVDSFSFYSNWQLFTYTSIVCVCACMCLKQMIFFLSFINTCVFLFYDYSPVFPARASYTQSSSGLHYFTNPSPTPESQMWSTTSANSEDFDRPKGGTLPDFQRLTNSYYTSNGRTAHINYGAQVVCYFDLIKTFDSIKSRE